MKTASKTAFYCMMAAVAFVASSWADGRDSLLHWWKVKDLNGDGLLQANEFYDIMTRGATTPKTGSTVYQATDGVDEKDLVTVETVDVYRPTMRKTVTEPVVHLHNPTNWEDGVLKCNYQAVEANQACIGRRLVNDKKEGTVFIRFKWDGRRFIKTGSNYNYAVPLYSDAYNSSSGWGWYVGLRCYDSGSANSMYPAFNYGNAEFGFYQNPHNSSFLIKANVWYDMAVTFCHEQIDGANYLTRAVMLRSGATSDIGNRQYYYDKRKSTFTPAWTEFGVNGHRISLGYHSYSGNSGGTTFVTAKDGGDNSFIGSIHEVKEYTKYMDEYELLETMVDGDPECMIGSKNGDSGEFSDSEAQDVYEPASMDWIKMRKTLTTATPLKVKLSLEANGHTLGRLIEMKFLKGTAFAGERVQIALNGLVFGSKRISDDGEMRFFIKPRLLETVQKDGETGLYPVTLTISRGDALSTSLQLDYLTVGGSWQLGAADNKTDGFGDTGSNYYNMRYHVGERNIAHMCGSIGNTGVYNPLKVYFGLSDWAAANLSYRLTVKSQNALAFPLYMTVNGATDSAWNWSGLSCYNGGGGTNVLFSAGTLQPGNCLNFGCDLVTGSTSWDAFDFLRLEALQPNDFRNSDEGLLLIVR